MNAALEMAKILKKRDNPTGYSPISGKIVALPDIKIRINEKVVLDGDDIKSIVNLLVKDEYGNYVWLSREVYMHPYGKKFIVFGGDEI